MNITSLHILGIVGITLCAFGFIMLLSSVCDYDNSDFYYDLKHHKVTFLSVLGYLETWLIVLMAVGIVLMTLSFSLYNKLSNSPDWETHSVETFDDERYTSGFGVSYNSDGTAIIKHWGWKDGTIIQVTDVTDEIRDSLDSYRFMVIRKKIVTRKELRYNNRIYTRKQTDYDYLLQIITESYVTVPTVTYKP